MKTDEKCFLHTPQTEKNDGMIKNGISEYLFIGNPYHQNK